MKCNQSRPGFELVSLCSFPMTITITPRASPFTIVIYLFQSDTNNFSNKSIWPIDGTLTITTTPGQSKPASNSNEWVLYTLQSTRTRCSLVSYSGYPFYRVEGEGDLTFLQEMQSVYSKSQGWRFYPDINVLKHYRKQPIILSVRYIIILSRHQHGHPWPSPATLLYHLSLPAGPQGNICWM